ncbi:YhcN/YlaJ family sporulation lipoprotein [Bhargavaea cecembensis]|uniref:YhcN/YlaJ family sporulation lipoprotein n=1 Tax=Bhargavaea cecembensis TaxID=394098 RepID=UPI00058F886B|nr:YhcN/YlaJ family sporulation lipoprotein [Bhargavaea cecembensis]
MKKYLVSLSALTLALGLSACGKTADEDPSFTENGHEENDMGVPADTDDEQKKDEGQSGEDKKSDPDVKLEVNQEAADKVKTVEGVEDASVMVAGDDAYVTVQLMEGTEEDTVFQSEIEDAAKSVIPEAKVHLSTDPETAEQVKGYSDRVGNNDDAVYDEFMEKAGDLFPGS